MEKRLLPHVVEKKYSSVDFIPEGIRMIQAPEMWGRTQGEGVVVAVIDTGIDRHHPDLQDRVIGCAGFTNTGNYEDDYGHGTHVTGTILASLNGIGVVGAAPKAKFLALKALDENGSGREEWTNRALDYAIRWRGDNGEKVNIISMSLSGPHNRKEHQLIKQARAHNILVVCAAGNQGDGDTATTERVYPGAYPEVVEVGAVDFDRKIADFSDTNRQLDFVAPGVEIISTFPGGAYAKMSGTSMATPHVSGAAALFWSTTKNPTPQKVYQQLQHCAVDLGYSQKAQGHGLVCVTSKGAKRPDKKENAAKVAG
ncbi:MAG TPA: S8 family peptidase [Bacillales bacterium]|nr:S8 family peptidase [Bacillales bacterium]